jgi:hypothetical protein
MIIRKQKVQKTIESLSQPTIVKVGFIISLMIGLAMSLGLWPTNAQAQAGEGQAYIVQADDWFSKIADKFYGDALPYHPLKIRSNLTYAVQARIEVDGALLFTNVSRYPALSQDAPETIEVMVEPVSN